MMDAIEKYVQDIDSLCDKLENQFQDNQIIKKFIDNYDDVHNQQKKYISFQARVNYHHTYFVDQFESTQN